MEKTVQNQTPQERSDEFRLIAQLLEEITKKLLETGRDTQRFVCLTDSEYSKSESKKYFFVKRRKVESFRKYLKKIIAKEITPKQSSCFVIIVKYFPLFMAYEEVETLVKINDASKKFF